MEGGGRRKRQWIPPHRQAAKPDLTADTTRDTVQPTEGPMRFFNFTTSSLFLLSFAVVFCPRLSIAQSQRGAVVGTVTDSTGAVVPSAKVEITQDATNAKFNATANENGYYNVPYLPYGRYTLVVNVLGFKTYTVTGVEVATATTTTVIVTL